MIVKGYNVVPLLKATVREIGDDRVPAMAASAAYNFFFSLFPLLLFLAPLMSLIGDEQQMIGFLTGQLVSVLPPEQVAAIGPILENMISADSAPTLVSIGLLLAAWSGSMIFGNLSSALNVAYDVQETRPFWRRIVTRLTMFGVGAAIIGAATIVLLGGEDVARWVGREFGIASAAVATWTVVQFPLALCGLLALAFMTYWILPNVKQKKGHAFAAAAFTTIAWILATLLFRLYVQHFPPNPAYGFIGGVIIMLGWMYFTMFVLLVGGELASELHHGTAAVEPHPGAVYLGRVVSSGGPGTASTDRIEGH